MGRKIYYFDPKTGGETIFKYLHFGEESLFALVEIEIKRNKNDKIQEISCRNISNLRILNTFCIFYFYGVFDIRGIVLISREKFSPISRHFWLRKTCQIADSTSCCRFRK